MGKSHVVSVFRLVFRSCIGHLTFSSFFGAETDFATFEIKMAAF